MSDEPQPKIEVYRGQVFIRGTIDCSNPEDVAALQSAMSCVRLGIPAKRLVWEDNPEYYRRRVFR